jgi:hypothetical protein
MKRERERERERERGVGGGLPLKELMEELVWLTYQNQIIVFYL